MVRNILPTNVECVFMGQPEELGLGHAVLCAERAVVDEPFAVLLADEFIMADRAGVTDDLVHKFEASGKSQLSVIKVEGKTFPNMGSSSRARMRARCSC